VKKILILSILVIIIAGIFTFEFTQSKTTTEDILFSDITSFSGIDFEHTSDNSYTNVGGGVSVIDYNKDGFEDIFFPNAIGKNELYQNNGDMTFTEVAKSVGLADSNGNANGACFADYNNDNNLDVFVTGYGTSKLFENNDGFFTDITKKAGLKDPNQTFRSTGCTWGDYDNDGYVDLIVTRWIVQSEKKPSAFDSRDFSTITRPLYLFHNNGNGTFTNVTFLLGDAFVSPSNVNGAGFQPAFFDYDNDGDQDIYIVNDFGQNHQPNVLWRNDGSSSNGEWIFTDISKPSQTNLAIFGMGLAVGDYDNNGNLDLFVTNMGDNVLLQNTGEDFFQNKTKQAGISAPILEVSIEELFMRDFDLSQIDIDMIKKTVEQGAELPPDVKECYKTYFYQEVTQMPIGWGTIFFDYDNDGFLDLYVVRGHMTDYMLHQKCQPNLLFRNNGDGSFTDISSKSGLDDGGYGRGVAYGDFNNDGCLDVVLVNIDQKAKLFSNKCSSDHNYLILKTVGAISNQDGIGARISVETENGIQIREIASGGSHMSQNMLAAHFGLERALEADVSILWPSGIKQLMTNIPVNQIVTITEPTS